MTVQAFLSIYLPISFNYNEYLQLMNIIFIYKCIRTLSGSHSTVKTNHAEYLDSDWKGFFLSEINNSKT